MKNLQMDFPIVTFIDQNGDERIDKQQTLDKAKEIVTLLNTLFKEHNLRFIDDKQSNNQ